MRCRLNEAVARARSRRDGTFASRDAGTDCSRAEGGSGDEPDQIKNEAMMVRTCRPLEGGGGGAWERRAECELWATNGVSSDCQTAEASRSQLVAVRGGVVSAVSRCFSDALQSQGSFSDGF